MTNASIACESCREMLSAHADGELPVLAADVTAHLESCAACREFQHDLGRVRLALRQWADEAPPVIRPTRMIRRIAAAAALIGAIAAGFAAGRATAPAASQTGGATTIAPAGAQAVERDRFVVPERNEIHSTISLAAVATGERDNSERSHP